MYWRPRTRRSSRLITPGSSSSRRPSMSNTMILVRPRSCWRTSSALSNCSSSSTNRMRGARVFAQVVDLRGRVRGVDAVGHAAAGEDGQVGQHPFDDGVGQDGNGAAAAAARGSSGRRRSRAPPRRSAARSSRARCPAPSAASRPAGRACPRRSRTWRGWCRPRGRWTYSVGYGTGPRDCSCVTSRAVIASSSFSSSGARRARRLPSCPGRTP